MCLAKIPDRAAQWTQGKAQQAGPAGPTGVQSPDPVSVEHAFRHAENICGRDPIAAFHGGVTDHVKPICSFIVKNASVQYQSPGNPIKYSASTVDRAGWQRLDDNVLSVRDGRMHAGSEGFERDGRALLEQGGDDFLRLGHADNQFWMEKV